MRLTYTNLFDSGTLTASTEATGYPATNIRHPFKTKTWRPTGVAAEWIKVNAGAAESFNMVAIVGHGFSGGDSVVLQANATDAWGAPSFTQAITVNSGIMLAYFAAQSYQWKRLLITAASTIHIGRVFIGTYYEPSKNFDINWRHSIVDLSKTERSIGGQAHTDMRSQFSRLTLPFSFMTKAQKNEFLTAIAAAGTHRPVIMSLDPTNDLNTLTFYGRFMGEFPFTGALENSTTNYHSTALVFDEEL